MGKGKGKNKNGGCGASAMGKVAAMVSEAGEMEKTKMKKGSTIFKAKGAKENDLEMADSFEAAILPIEICSNGGIPNETKADLVDPFEDGSEGEESEEESEAASRTLGEEDSDCTPDA